MSHNPIPEQALQKFIAVLGKIGSGKTFAVKGLVERLLEEHRRVGIVDPTGAWWGLRSSRDGKGPGFPILVLGGDHGDLPLPALGGAAVARLLADDVNLVADTSQLTVGERTRWFIDFATTLYRANRTPLHLVIDEAHNFAPQGKVIDVDSGKMLHAANQIATGGRSRGLRLTVITQRPQKLHKDTLTSADTLIAMRVMHPLDRGAVQEWINGCGDPQFGKEVMATLANLATGEGWVWYPEGKFLQRLKFPAIKTFDSSATPTDGGSVAAPRAVADIDLTEIRAALADAVKEAEANDPKLLRAEIARLKREAGKPTIDLAAVHAAEKRGFDSGFERGQADILQAMRAVVTEAELGMAQATARLRQFANEVGKPHPVVSTRPPTKYPPPAHSPPTRVSAPASSDVGKAMPRAMMIALAQHPHGLSKGQILVHTGYRSSGPVSACFAELARNGWTEGASGQVRITPAGLAALGPYEPLPTGEAMRRHLLNGSKCSGMEKAMLSVLFDAYPNAVAKGAILEATGYASSGPVSAAFARLVALGYAKKSHHGHLGAADELFE